jgi:hypothetical protein
MRSACLLGRAARRLSVIGMVWLGFAAPALAQQLGQGGDVAISWWRVVAALAICLALTLGAGVALRARQKGGGASPGQGPMALLEAVLRRRGLGGASQRLKLVETLRLSHQVEVCLCRYDEIDFVIAATPHGAFLVTPGATGANGDPK